MLSGDNPNCSPHPRRLRAAVSRLAASVDREQRPTYYFDMDDFPVLVSALSKERRMYSAPSAQMP